MTNQRKNNKGLKVSNAIERVNGIKCANVLLPIMLKVFREINF